MMQLSWKALIICLVLQKKPSGCVLQLWVKVTGYLSPILAVWDGGAEIAFMSKRVFDQLGPQPELHPTNEKVKGLYGPNHSPVGECTVKLAVPELSVAITYDVKVDNIDEDFLIDALMLHYTHF